MSQPIADTHDDDKNVVQDGVHSVPVDLGDKFTAHNTVGLAVIEQNEIIPTTGQRRTTTGWEYWTFCVLYFAPNGSPIGSDGASLCQLLLTEQFPDLIPFGGQQLSVNSLFLDLTAIIFAGQLVVLLAVGPFADYGRWRAWLLIFFQTIVIVCTLGMCGITQASQWKAALILYVIGTFANNMVLAFYSATFPGLVQDLPNIQASEQAVLMNEKTPQEHDDLVQYERSKLNNLYNVVGSSVQVAAYAIAVGIAAALPTDTNEQLIKSYQVLMGFFGAITILSSVPFFVVQQHRPGQQMPKDASFLAAGPKQIWSAVRNIKYLKQCLLYLFAYFMLQESYGSYYQVFGILQNEVVSFSPVLVNAFAVVGNLCGGGGNLACYLAQRKWRFSMKKAIFFGAAMPLIPNLWGGIGAFTQVIGFHHVWEFWWWQAYNFFMAAWNAYQVAFLAEVVPVSKAYMYFSLFNTVGRTSGFIGPLISAAITTVSNNNYNMPFWFLFSMGFVGWIFLYFVNTDKAKLDNAKYLEREARELYGRDAPSTVEELRSEAHPVV